MGRSKYIEHVYSDDSVDEKGAYVGTYSIVRRRFDDGTEHVFMRFPNTKHEVWDVEDLKLMKELLERFFEEEGLTGDDGHEHEDRVLGT